MKKLRIYLDTSVLGGYFDKEFKIWTEALVEDFRKRRYIPVLSEATAIEVGPAPEHIKELHNELLGLGGDFMRFTEESAELVRAYSERAILGPKFKNDLLHIALATVGVVDLLLSWNFKHIVQFDKMRQFNAVNIEQGYKTLEIHSPREVISHDSDE